MLINRKAVRNYALEQAKKSRHQAFTRVSASFLNDTEARLADLILKMIAMHPSVGHTLQGDRKHASSST
jgi:hypothetical protein